MDFFSVLTFVGGLSLFLFGMNIMGKSLEKQAGGRFKAILEKVTSNPISGIVLGTGITAIIQSSSATTVMVVGFVNAGIMTLENSVGVIMGANIGTTATAWLISLTSIESTNFFLQLCKPTSFSPVLALVGICLTMLSKSERKKDVGNILLGFAILMYGMDTMSTAVKPLADVPAFTSILTMFSNPLFGVLAGLAVTAVIQSSSASVGILQAMAMTGSITVATALPIIMGQNIGTCVTAIISSTGTSPNARRAALIHLYYNILGVVVFLAIFYSVDAIWGWPFMDTPVNAVSIAVIHTVFNVFNTGVFLPFRKQLVKLAVLSVKSDEKEEKFKAIDDRFLASPGLAVAQCHELTVNMAELSCGSLLRSIKLVSEYNEAEARQLISDEAEVDMYEDKLGTYLVKLSSKSMSLADSHSVSKLLHSIGDFERISDHAINISRTGEEMFTKNIRFSDAANKDLNVMTAAVLEIVEISLQAFINNDMELAQRVEPLEQVVDLLKSQLKARHIARLQRGECTTMLGFVFSDLITNFERVADHCSNIAVCILQVNQDTFDTHEYLNTLKNSDDSNFNAMYDEYSEKYQLIQSS